MKKRGEVSNAVLEALEDGPKSSREIAAHADLTASLVSATLNRLKHQEHVKPIGNAQWALTRAPKPKAAKTAPPREPARAQTREASPPLVNGAASDLRTKIRALHEVYKLGALEAGDVLDRIVALVEKALT